MKEKSKSIIQAVIGAVIMIIGIVLCVNTYVVKGNKAYAFSLLVTIIGAVVLISGLYNTFCKSEKKPVDAKVIAQAARILKTLLHLIILLVTSVTAVYTEWSALTVQESQHF